MSSRHQARRRRQRLSRQLARAHRHPVAAPLSMPPPIPLPAPIPIPVTVPVPMALSGSGRLRGRLTAVLIRAPEPIPAPMPVPVPMPDKPATTPPLVGKRPCAATPFALVRWKPSRYCYQMREPTAYYASRELALAAAAILIDEPCPPTVVDATVTVEKRRPIDEILQDLQDRRGVIQTPYPGKRRDGLDDNEPPLKHSKAPRDRRPANDHPWNGGVDRSVGNGILFRSTFKDPTRGHDRNRHPHCHRRDRPVIRTRQMAIRG